MPGTAYLAEIMSTIQGEGLYIGLRQIFIRFAGCNLNCRFCDTNFQKNKFCRIEKSAGEGNFINHPNPITARELLKLTESLGLSGCHSISLTGGEPLLWNEYLKEFLSLLPNRTPKVLLETNGTLVNELRSVIHLVDIVAMDIKLPSVTSIDPCWDKHHDFLSLASTKECFVKIVISADTHLEELTKACRIISSINTEIPLVLQPVTAALEKNIKAPTPAQLFKMQDLGMALLNEVRVIPQTHKYLGLL